MGIIIALLQLGYNAFRVIVGNEEKEEVLLGSAGGIMSRIALSSIRVLKSNASKGVSVIRLQARHSAPLPLEPADVGPLRAITENGDATESGVHGDNWSELNGLDVICQKFYCHLRRIMQLRRMAMW